MVLVIVLEEEGKGEVFRSRGPEAIPRVLISEEVINPPREKLLAPSRRKEKEKYILVRSYSPMDNVESIPNSSYKTK
ncbi:hypothetical protein DRN52_06450, partial [Thermococci archaeon]